MTTFARLWVILASSYMVASGLLTVVIRHTIDLRLEVLVQYAAIPFVQAMVLAWLVKTISLRSIVENLGIAVRQPPVAGLWCITASLLVGYWMPWFTTDLTQILLRVAACEAIAAVILLVWGLQAGAGAAIWKVAPFAILVFLLASNAIDPWLGNLPRLLPSDWPLLVRQAIVLWTLLLTILALASFARSVVRVRNCTSAFFLSTVSPLAIIAALAVSLNWSLYSYLVEPWSHVVVTCILIGATATLTATLVRTGSTHDSSDAAVDESTTVGRHHQIGFLGLWLLLTLTAVAATACLHALVQGRWNWGLTAWLSMTLPPLVQTAWLRFCRELRSLPSVARELAAKPMVLVLVELIAMVWLWFSPVLTEVDMRASQLGLAAYAALKIAVFGAAIVAINRRRNPGVVGLGWLATLTGIAGIWAAFTGVSVLFPIVGLLLVRGALARRPGQPIAGFHLSAADALLAPALVLVVGDLFSQTTALVVATPIALSLIVFSTSAAAMSFHAEASRDDPDASVLRVDSR